MAAANDLRAIINAGIARARQRATEGVQVPSAQPQAPAAAPAGGPPPGAVRRKQ
jgi:hypothetical protein